MGLAGHGLTRPAGEAVQGDRGAEDHRRVLAVLTHLRR